MPIFSYLSQHLDFETEAKSIHQELRSEWSNLICEKYKLLLDYKNPYTEKSKTNS